MQKKYLIIFCKDITCNEKGTGCIIIINDLKIKRGLLIWTQSN